MVMLLPLSKECHPNVLQAIAQLPKTSGVYLFKDIQGIVVYVGKAKNLKARVSSYVKNIAYELKAQLILEVSTSLEYLETAHELEALVVEAKLIQSYQPRYNVLLKTGQPFLYLMISNAQLPVLSIVRNKQKKGTYFGPFVEKSAVRRMYNFLERTFKLMLCGKKVAGGCLNYHLGICAGSCKPDFDQEGYLERLRLAQQILEKGHKKFLQYLQAEIAENNKQLNFERSRELHQYVVAVGKIFDALDAQSRVQKDIERKDVWLLSSDNTQLFVYQERGGVFKKRHGFAVTIVHSHDDIVEIVKECFLGFYRSFAPSALIIINIDLGADAQLYETFLTEQYALQLQVHIHSPQEGHLAAVMRMGMIHMQQELERKGSLALQLQKLFELSAPIHSIDCFDISHKQGTAMVGACIRFIDGKPAPDYFRKFEIKTVVGQDDYASLREVVMRRYRNKDELPDLVLIDGGKGQLSAVAGLIEGGEFASLAKREETVFSSRFPAGKVLKQELYVSQVLIALRDYTHHFAISYHRAKERIEKAL